MKKSAFTLLEVVIVIIIIGVLTSLALPKLFSVVEGVRAVEAISMISTIRSAMERCYLMHNGSYKNCESNTIDIGQNATSGSEFSYGLRSAAEYWYVIAMNKNDVDKELSMCFGCRLSFDANGYINTRSMVVNDETRGKIQWLASEHYRAFIPKSE